MFSNAHLLESEVISNAEGDISRVTSLTATKEQQSIAERYPQEEEISKDSVPNTKPVTEKMPVAEKAPEEFKPVQEPITAPSSPTIQPVQDEPTVVVNVNEGKEAVPVMIDPVVGVGEGTPIIPVGGGGGFIGGGGASRSMAEEEMGEMPVVEEGGSNWWIWVALAGTGLAAWYVFGKKKKG
jgi:hypothetical protein